jgi:hypothetical protein
MNKLTELPNTFEITGMIKFINSTVMLNMNLILLVGIF